MWFLLFCRFFPTISMAEVKSVLWSAKKTAAGHPKEPMAEETIHA
jgi:hypothetical protein